MRYELKNNRNGEKIDEFLTTVDVVKTDKELSFEFFCKNSKFYSASNEYNGLIYNGDVCEAFISTGNDITVYYEIEVAPNGTIFLYKMKNLGVGMFDATPIPEEDCFVTAEVEKLNDTDYRVKFSMPLEKIGYDEKIGITFNAFRIETEGGIIDKNILALSPTLCETFHCVDSFIKL